MKAGWPCCRADTCGLSPVGDKTAGREGDWASLDPGRLDRVVTGRLADEGPVQGDETGEHAALGRGAARAAAVKTAGFWASQAREGESGSRAVAMPNSRLLAVCVTSGSDAR